MISAIVAVDNNWGIGFNGDLLEHIPEDLKYFKQLTAGNVVIMGRKTWDSLPNKPLPNRLNIVITSQKRENKENVKFMSLKEAKQYAIINRPTNVFIIGGGNVYAQFINRVDKLYVTHIHHSWDDADTFFPQIDTNIWLCTSEEHHEPDDKHLYPYTFAEYSKRK